MEDPESRQGSSQNVADHKSPDELVMDFYNMDTLFPQLWVDDPSQQRHSEEPNESEIRDDFDNEDLNDEDPLAIKDSVLSAVGMDPNDRRRTIFILRKANRAANKDNKSHLLIGHKSFDARKFLREVHYDTGFPQLAEGSRKLKGQSEKFNEWMKLLVRDNFEQFTRAKWQMEDIYLRSAKGSVDDLTDGTSKLIEDVNYTDYALQNVIKAADDIFQPILDRRLRAERIRALLEVVDRQKFFFNLPSVLEDSIKSGRYDHAMREFRKGKELMDADTIAKDKVLETVWLQVEKILKSFTSTLYSQLEDLTLPLVTHESAIRYLQHLEPASGKPMQKFIDNRHRWLVDMMKSKYDDFEVKLLEWKGSVKGLGQLPLGLSQSSLNHSSRSFLQSMELSQRSEGSPKLGLNESQRQSMPTAAQFRQAMTYRSSKRFESLMGESPDLKLWKALFHGAKGVSTVMVQNLPEFVKVCKSLVKPASKHPGTTAEGNDPDILGRLNEMTNKIVESYVDMVGKIFHIATPPGVADDILSPPLSANPKTCRNPLIHCYFIARTYPGMVGCYLSVRNVYKGAFWDSTLSGHQQWDNPKVRGLKEMASAIDQLKRRFLELLCQSWLHESKQFFRYEDWSLESETNMEITGMLRLFYRFQRHMLKACFKVSQSLQSGSSSSSRSEPVSSRGTNDHDKSSKKVSAALLELSKDSFLDSFFLFLDGLHHLVFIRSSSEESEEEHGLDEQEGVVVEEHEGEDDEDVDSNVVLATSARRAQQPAVDDVYRVLISLSNLTCLSQIMLPRLLEAFCNLFGVSAEEDSSRLKEAIKELDRRFFEGYLREKNMRLQEIVNRGVVDKKHEYQFIGEPTDVRPYLHEALMLLVLTHAEVYGACRSMIPRILTTLVMNLLRTLLDAFRQVSDFGSVGGMLQATLEAEFAQRVLSEYLDGSAAEVYDMIVMAIAREPPEEELDEETRERQLALYGVTDEEGMKESRALRVRHQAYMSKKRDLIHRILPRVLDQSSLQYSCLQAKPALPT